MDGGGGALVVGEVQILLAKLANTTAWLSSESRSSLHDGVAPDPPSSLSSNSGGYSYSDGLGVAGGFGARVFRRMA